tara:strand:- start:51 stop:317 length:267 start_codon:yes stop_codon:yes gene_type:complete
MKTTVAQFSIGAEGCLMRVDAGMPAGEALELAANLAEGIQLLSERLYDAVNDNSEIVHLSELRSIGFLGEVVSALSRSVYRAAKESAK